MISPPESNENWDRIRAEFVNDVVGKYVKNYLPLCTRGNVLSIKDGYEQKKYIRDKLRVVATLCTKYHAVYGREEYSVQEIFKSKNVDKIVKIAQEKWDNSLTPPVRLGCYIKEISLIFKQYAIVKNDEAMKTEAENLWFLVDRRWQTINAPNIKN